MHQSINSTTTEVPPHNFTSPVAPPGFTTPEYVRTTSSTSSSSSASICCLNSSTAFPSPASKNYVTESMEATSTSIDDQVAKDAFENYEEHYTTPISILLLNFFLVAFLMIVIGIAVYPAMKRYCDSTFTFGNSDSSDSNCNAYWIEDTDEASASASSSSAITGFPPNLYDSSMALLNCTGGATMLASSIDIDDFGGSSDIELLPEIRQSDNMQ